MDCRGADKTRLLMVPGLQFRELVDCADLSSDCALIVFAESQNRRPGTLTIIFSRAIVSDR